MRPFLLAASLLCAAASARADGIAAGAPDCGGEAFSSAVVIEHRPPRRGPVAAVPDTLCADLTPQQPPSKVDIIANPVILPGNGPESGSGRPPAPYDGRPPFVGGPPRSRHP